MNSNTNTNMNTNMFTKASRKRAFLKLAITGPSGSGKTFSALRIARGLAGTEGKIALIDTENESASLYANVTDFDTAVIAAPFTTSKYEEAIRMAADAGYSVLIIDSLTHAWAGEGGLLAQKESLDARGGNSFTNWSSITKKQETFKSTILQSPIHIIATMRSKHEYVVEQNGSKSVPKKVGLSPIQRDGMEYEFTVVLDIAMNHEAAASKDRTGLFDGKFEVPSEEHGKRLRTWLDSGAVETSLPVAAIPEPVAADVPIPAPAPVKKPHPGKEKFDEVAAANGLVFTEGPDRPKERGRWANVCLGRPQDSALPITLEEWFQAAEALPARIAEEKASQESGTLSKSKAQTAPEKTGTVPPSQAQDEARQRVAALATPQAQTAPQTQSAPTPSAPSPMAHTAPGERGGQAAGIPQGRAIPQGRPVPTIHRNTAPEPKIPMRPTRPVIDDGFGGFDDFEDPFGDDSTSATSATSAKGSA